MTLSPMRMIAALVFPPYPSPSQNRVCMYTSIHLYIYIQYISIYNIYIYIYIYISDLKSDADDSGLNVSSVSQPVAELCL